MKTVKINKYLAGKKYQERTLPNTGNDTLALAKVNAIYRAIVGSFAQVQAGVATHTSVQSAINASVAGNTILVLPGTYTENVTQSTRLFIEGLGYDTFINGTWSFVGGSFSYLHGIRVTQFIFDATSNGNIIHGFWSTAESNLGAGNLIQGVNIT